VQVQGANDDCDAPLSSPCFSDQQQGTQGALKLAKPQQQAPKQHIKDQGDMEAR